jgi:hypothetical protein
MTGTHLLAWFAGIANVLCGGALVFDVLPDPFSKIAVAVCGVLTGLGIIGAAHSGPLKQP